MLTSCTAPMLFGDKVLEIKDARLFVNSEAAQIQQYHVIILVIW